MCKEMPDDPVHEHYLWGQAALTEDLQLHNYQELGETVLKPCAKIPLTKTGARMTIEQGLFAPWSVRNADRIHLDDFHSIAV